MDRDPVIISLTQQLALLQSKLATRIAELGKDHEQVQQTEQLIGEVKEQMEVRRIEVAKQVGQVRLRQAQGQLVVLSQKREELENMRAEAEAQQRELDSARIQYQKRLAIKDERQERLDAIKEQIEKLKIMHDDPEVDEVSRGFYERLTAARAEGLDRRLSRQEIAAKLASLEDRRRRIEVELSVAEEAMQEVRTRYGFTDLEDRSYPHPVTQRLIRLERQRDECTLEIAQLQAQIGNLEDQADTPQGKANLKKAQEELVILSERLEALQEMSEQAEAKKRDLDVARVQHKQRAAIRDERKRMLESIKADIERWKILHDDPQTLETPPAPEAR
jgi:chromosome segregation ATPase